MIFNYLELDKLIFLFFLIKYQFNNKKMHERQNGPFYPQLLTIVVIADFSFKTQPTLHIKLAFFQAFSCNSLLDLSFDVLFCFLAKYQELKQEAQVILSLQGFILMGILNASLYLAYEYNKIEMNLPMSHFYPYPLLLSQGYSTFEIQQILHSFGLFPSYQFSAPQYPLLPPQSQNFMIRSNNPRNFIIRQDSRSISQYNSMSENGAASAEQKEPVQKNQPIKLEPIGRQEPISYDQNAQKREASQQKGGKRGKKKKIKKMTLKEKREKQMKRNKTQNSKRNIIPNQIHQMLSILFKNKKSSHLVQKLIKKFSLSNSKNSFSTQRFYLYQSFLKDKISHYANEQSLKILLTPLEPSCKIYSEEEQILYCKIGLALISYFLNNQAALIILNSQRIKSENKLDHLKTKRYLSYVLKQIISLGKQKTATQFVSN